MVFEPLAGQRRVRVTERRTAVDFAHGIQELVDELYPQAEKIGVLPVAQLDIPTAIRYTRPTSHPSKV
jgi:hypothetical protein